MWYLTIFTLLFLHPSYSSQRTVHTTASRAKTVDVNSTTLAADEPCGVFTLKCGPGLKCLVPEKDPKPLTALLEGRGRCGNMSRILHATEANHSIDTVPTEAGDNEGPCRKLLTDIVKNLGSQLIKTQELYLPNCERDGFYKNKQCWSSRGRQRGRCWCVDKYGTPLSVNTTLKSSTVC